MTTFHKFVWARRITSLAVFSALLCWVLSSCEQDKLCYDHNHPNELIVYFAWEEAYEESPASMFLYLFPDTPGKNVLKREFAGNEKGRCNISARVGYDAITFNSDIRNIVVKNANNRDSLLITTCEATVIDKLGLSVSELPVSKKVGSQRLLSEPEYLFIDRSDEKIYVDSPGDEKTEIYRSFAPKKEYCTYHIIINKVLNPTKVASGIAASISGLSSGIFAWSGKKSTEAVMVPFAVSLDTDKATINGSMTCFGRVDNTSVKNILTIYTTLCNGEKFSFDYDVTEQILNAADPYNVEIVLKELPVPNAINASGMKPDVDNWQGVDVPVKM